MKSERYYLISERVRDNAIARIRDIELNGTVKVVILNAGTKSSRQRGLQWRWYTEVSEAGIGGAHEDTKECVNLLSKWRWAIPIMIRDDEFFADLFAAWKEMHGSDEERMRWFVDNQVSTEAFSSSQMAEYLNAFHAYYSQIVRLTEPSKIGL